MGMPCQKYLVVMLPMWLPLLGQAGDLDHPFVTPAAIEQLESMQLRGISTTKPPPLLRNSIGLSTGRR